MKIGWKNFFGKIFCIEFKVKDYKYQLKYDISTGNIFNMDTKEPFHIFRLCKKFCGMMNFYPPKFL